MADDLASRLAALSAAATQKDWWPNVPLKDAEFIAALVNAYRAGEIVVVPVDWTLCADRMPPEGMVLAFGGRSGSSSGGQEVLYYSQRQSDNGWPLGYQSYNTPTHWKPLGAPPAEAGAQTEKGKGA